MTVRWGIAAPGHIAAQFAEGLALVDDAELVAVGSRAKERADAFGDRFDIPTRYGSYDELMEDTGVDVVYVATPHAQHEAVVLQAIEGGKHVLCEKPFALNATQATRMAEAARARGVFAMEALWSRFLPSYRAVAELLRDERIGEPMVVEADFGFRVPLMPEHRLFDLAQGGGALLDLGIYPLQLCSMVLGTPDHVVAEGHVGETGADEQVAAVLHHSGGRLGVIKAATRDRAVEHRAHLGHRRLDRAPGMDAPPDPRRRGLGQHPSIGSTLDYDGEGLRFQAIEVQRASRPASIESPVVPLDETIALARTMDEIRAQIGVRATPPTPPEIWAGSVVEGCVDAGPEVADDRGRWERSGEHVGREDRADDSLARGRSPTTSRARRPTRSCRPRGRGPCDEPGRRRRSPIRASRPARARVRQCERRCGRSSSR